MIKMEHPQLPRTVDDPPTQLWLKHIDGEVSSKAENLAGRRADVSFRIALGQARFLQRCH